MQETPRLVVQRDMGEKKAETLTPDIKKKKRSHEQLSLFSLTSLLLSHITVLRQKVRSLTKRQVLSDCPVMGHLRSSH